MSDLIKREDAIEAIKQWLDNDGSLFDVGLNQAIREIKRLPSADRPQGEWIDIEPRLNRRRVNKYKRCSHCGFSWARPFDDNYCPNCGCRMKGAEL